MKIEFYIKMGSIAPQQLIEQFLVYVELFSPSASISFAAYYSPDYHNALVMNSTALQ